jgi:hypothetical protein
MPRDRSGTLLAPDGCELAIKEDFLSKSILKRTTITGFRTKSENPDLPIAESPGKADHLAQQIGRRSSEHRFILTKAKVSEPRPDINGGTLAGHGS